MPLAHRRGAAGGARCRCEACTDAPPAFDATLALADYRAPLDLLARGLKFRARLALGEEFARRLALAAQDMCDEHGMPEIVVPAPLSRERLIERGYNQAWQIARPLARRLGTHADATPYDASCIQRRNRSSIATRAAATSPARSYSRGRSAASTWAWSTM